jgi:hypothetical protein
MFGKELADKTYLVATNGKSLLQPLWAVWSERLLAPRSTVYYSPEGNRRPVQSATVSDIDVAVSRVAQCAKPKNLTNLPNLPPQSERTH